MRGISTFVALLITIALSIAVCVTAFLAISYCMRTPSGADLVVRYATATRSGRIVTIDLVGVVTGSDSVRITSVNVSLPGTVEVYKPSSWIDPGQTVEIVIVVRGASVVPGQRITVSIAWRTINGIQGVTEKDVIVS